MLFLGDAHLSHGDAAKRRDRGVGDALFRHFREPYPDASPLVFYWERTRFLPSKYLGHPTASMFPTTSFISWFAVIILASITKICLLSHLSHLAANYLSGFSRALLLPSSREQSSVLHGLCLGAARQQNKQQHLKQPTR